MITSVELSEDKHKGLDVKEIKFLKLNFEKRCLLLVLISIVFFKKINIFDNLRKLLKV